MSPSSSSLRFYRTFSAFMLGLALLVGCSPPVQRPTGAARDFEDAKDMFKRGRLDRATDFTNGPASAMPPNAFTERARVLRVVIFSGQVKAYKELVDAYQKGVQNTKNPRFKADYERLIHDYLQYGSRLALALGESEREPSRIVAHASVRG